MTYWIYLCICYGGKLFLLEWAHFWAADLVSHLTAALNHLYRYHFIEPL